jgi:hypothetical protein
MVTLLTYAMIIGLGWASGVLPQTGFALASDVNDVKASLLAKEIDDVSAALCMEAYEPRLLSYRRELQEQYREVEGEYHESPSCEVLMKIKR